jgi:hypothetical protein
MKTIPAFFIRFVSTDCITTRKQIAYAIHLIHGGQNFVVRCPGFNINSFPLIFWAGCLETISALMEQQKNIPNDCIIQPT